MLLSSMTLFILFIFLHSLPFFSLAFHSHPKIPSNPPNSKSLCSNRCNRLLQRSLGRLDQSLSAEEVLHRIGAFRKAQLLNGQGTSEELALPARDFKEICWKFFDLDDCQKQCQKVFRGGRKKRKKRRRGANGQGQMAEQQQEHRLILHFCRRANFALPLDQFACIHKYHSFMEVHCSTYQQRAVQLRLVGLQLDQPNIADDKFGGKEELAKLKRALDQELCLLLHQHGSCLVNTGARFCPISVRSANPILSGSSLREHFLSLLLPFGLAIDQQHMEGPKDGAAAGDSPMELDQLFPDHLLDHCQLFDFHKMAKEWMEKMEGTTKNEEEGGGGGKREFETTTNGRGGGLNEEEEANDQQQRSTTKRAIWPIKTLVDGEEGEEEDDDDDDEGIEVTISPSSRRVFSSEEDLLDTPPNFFYSTARLPKDFYTRYAIWWGSRGEAKSNERRKSKEGESQEEEEELTAVQLLPSAAPPRAHSQMTLNSNWPIDQWQRRTTKTTTMPTVTNRNAVSQTKPDSTLSTPMHSGDGRELAAGNDVAWTITTLPYLVNGRATTPVQRWPGEVTRTEIQLMDGTTRRIWTASEREEAEWRRRAEAEREAKKQREEERMGRMPSIAGEGEQPSKEGMKRRKQQQKPQQIEEYEEEWAYEDAFEASQFEEEEEGEKPFISSSVEELIKEIEPNNGGKGLERVRPTTQKSIDDNWQTQLDRTPMGNSAEEEEGETEGGGNVQLLPLPTTTEEPMFRETNIYFAKILEFGQEPEAETDWMAPGGQRKKGDAISPATKTIAHMVHYPGDQLPIREDQPPKSAELDLQKEEGQRHQHHNHNHNQHHPNNPYEILPADPNQFMTTIGMKTATPADLYRVHWNIAGHPTERPKIVVSAEPIPAKKSETLLVLLGIYLTFFAVASFFLLCLVLTCFERNRRQASRRQSAAKGNSGSAILYMDPKKGTLKHVV